LHSITGGPRVTTGAYINFYLKEKPNAPLEITITDSEGNKVKTIKSNGSPGINRISWDLAYEPAHQVKLRIKPPGNPTVVEEKRFRETWTREGWYPLLSWGTSGGFRGIQAAPGEYTITVTYNKKEYSKTLTVLKDPGSAGTNENIEELVEMQLELRENINSVTAIVNSMEWMRRQLADLKHLLEDKKMVPTVIPAVEEFDSKIVAIEDKIIQPYSREGDSKSFRFPNLLYTKLSVLAGDVAQNIDFSPNKQQKEVHKILKERIAEYSSEFQDLLENDLPVFNNMLEAKNISGIIVLEY
jgi:hypothetical protein